MATDPSSLPLIDNRFDFPNEELKILAYWNSIDAFNRSVQLSKEAKRPIYTFYDGPPFATGLPHYGHILAGTIKDIVLRYAHQKGYHVERRFGWDCHGLPIEHEIDKKLGITCREDVLKMGIDKYNEECRAIVTRYSNDWEAIVNRSGRWIDFKNDFKTMYPSFMESVWWVFKQLFSKNLVYKGFKVMPYSTACTSPLSNFEANLNYKETTDPSVVVAFPLIDDPLCSLLTWTTTPWTLTSNLAITCHPDFDYVTIRDLESGRIFILAESCLSILYKDPSAQGLFELLDKKKGSQLVGLKYKPLFDFFEDRASTFGNFVVVSDNYVTGDTGTGLVHCAPGFGEDDHRVALHWGIIKSDESFPCPVDEVGRFNSSVPPYQGIYFKDTDKEIMKVLKSKGQLIRQSQVTHNYPFCWRSDTPLIYKAVPSWFIRVKGHNEDLLKNNDKTYWVPDHVREKKFANWLASAHDWAVSRNRYWGTPIPIWTSEDGEEIVVIGSIDELKERTGASNVDDIHRHFIDHLTIPSSRPGCPPLRRIEEVFDCWFESGSVPYAAQHYPFENKEIFDQHFPADFIGEGIDQTRGWFYTLMVLSTHLFNEPPFKNLIVNGLVLASDGKKMSKRLKNYPEPTLIMNSYGADALRLYLINSPVVCAEFLRFKEDGVMAVLRDVFLPWVNVMKFFTEQASLFEKEENDPFKVNFYLDDTVDASQSTDIFTPSNKMDHWILSSLHSMIQFVRQEMDAYRLYTVLPKLLGFVDSLCNCYVRLNRQRLKGYFGSLERKESLTTLFYILFDLSRIMAPIVPFLADNMYLKLRMYLAQPLSVSDDRSVHFLLLPQVQVARLDPVIERSVSRLLAVIEMVRTLREAKNISLRAPLSDIVLLTDDEQVRSDLESLQYYLLGELNLRTITFRPDLDSFDVEYTVTPNFAVLGKRLRNDIGKVQAGLKTVSKKQLQEYLQSGQPIVVEGHSLSGDDLAVVRKLAKVPEGYVNAMNAELIVLLNTVVSEELEAEALAREIINRVQKLRKRTGLKASDEVGMFYRVTKPDPQNKLAKALQSQSLFISKTLKQDLVSLPVDVVGATSILGEEVVDLVDGSLSLLLAAQLRLNGS